jgi:L-amino acid N-acyltransferase YncA
MQASPSVSQGNAPPTLADTTHPVPPAQTSKTSLGDGLVQLVPQSESPAKDAVDNSGNNAAEAVPQTVGELDTVAGTRRPKANLLTATEDHTIESSQKLQQRIAASSEPHFRVTSVKELSNLATVPPKSVTRAKLPQWGQSASEPSESTPSNSHYFPLDTKETRAARRPAKPSLAYYQKREARNQRITRPQSAAPGDQTLLEQFEYAKMKTHQEIDQRRIKRNQKKHATTDLVLLHKIRLPMSAEKEKLSKAKVEHYAKLGESPSNWPVSTTEAEPGTASEAFARSRDDIRAGAIRTGEHKQAARGWTDDVLQEKDQDHLVPEHLRQAKPKRNPRWVTSKQTKPEARKAGSNDWGSAHPDDLTTSGDSLAVDNGSSDRPVQDGPDPGLLGWDGKFLEAPADWESRPKSKPQKYHPSHGDFGEFLTQSFHQQYPPESFVPLPVDMVLNIDLHADGISMTPRAQTITRRSYISHLGHSDAVLTEVRNLLRAKPDPEYPSQFLNGTNDMEFDRIDAPSPHTKEEIGYIETSEIYSQRYLAMNKGRFNLADDQPTTPRADVEEPVPEFVIKKPSISIYLRPAATADLPQLAEIYNWHIENGPRPTEMDPVSTADIRDRFEDAEHHKLPLIVAVGRPKSKKHSRGSLQNVNMGYQPIVAEERIVGWTSATDWSASDYVERISAEIEVYVDPEFRMQGVGRCLMDKMLQICDCGYIPCGGYDFHCLPEHTWKYGGGGARDLHKIWFILRNWSKPVQTPEDQKLVKASDREDEVDIWLKPWLESMGFAQEGHLKQVGVKKGRL